MFPCWRSGRSSAEVQKPNCHSGSGKESLACLCPRPMLAGVLPATGPETLAAQRVPVVLGRVAIPKKCRDRQRAAVILEL